MAGLDGFDTGNMEGGIECWKHTAPGLMTLDIRKGPTNLGANLQDWKRMHGDGTHPGMEAQWRTVSVLPDSEMEQVWDEEMSSWATIRDFDLWDLNVPNDYPNHAVLGKMVAAFRGWFSALNCKGAGIMIAILGPRNDK